MIHPKRGRHLRRAFAEAERDRIKERINAATTLCAGAHAWIEKIPKQEFKRGATVREWPVICSDLNVLVGSNPSK